MRKIKLLRKTFSLLTSFSLLFQSCFGFLTTYNFAYAQEEPTPTPEVTVTVVPPQEEPTPEPTITVTETPPAESETTPTPTPTETPQLDLNEPEVNEPSAEFNPSVSTDKDDYPPTGTVILTGKDFPANTELRIKVTWPDGQVRSASGEIGQTDTAKTDDQGNLTFFYPLRGEGQEGEYLVEIINGETVLVTINFTDSSETLIINEFDYDQPGTDDAEFIEIKNISSSSVNLDSYEIRLINGSGGGASLYNTFDLPDFSLDSGDYFVLCANNANTSNCNLDVTPETDLIQNGDPDTIALFKRDASGDILIDTVSYEGDVPGYNDTNNNKNDFVLSCITPGLANVNTTDCTNLPANVCPEGGDWVKFDLVDSDTGKTHTTDSGYVIDQVCIKYGQTKVTVPPDSTCHSVSGLDTQTATVTEGTFTSECQDISHVSFHKTLSQGYCGDGVLDPGEECDGDEPQTCTAIDGYPGTRTCSNCLWSECRSGESCGDGIVNGNEQCDDGSLNGQSNCSSSCNWVVSCEPEMIANGSFEMPAVTHSAKWDIFESYEVPGWTAEWYGNGGGRPEPQIELHRGVLGSASDGDQHVELDTDWDGPGGPLNGEAASITLYQEIPVMNGYEYKLSWKYSPRPKHNNNHLQVKVGDGEVFDSGVMSGGTSVNWSEETRTFIAESDGLVKISFAELGNPDSLGMFLDDVSVECLGSTTGSLTICKFNDENTNSQKETDELLIDWKFRLGDGEWRETTDGCVSFEELEPGEYQVEEESRQGWINTTDNPFTATVTAGEETLVYFGNNYLGYCGDGIKNGGEECDGEDLGDADSESNFCTTQCKLVPVYYGGNSCPPEYPVQQLLETYTVSSTDADGILVPVTTGGRYLFEALGTYRPTQRDAVPAMWFADAGYSTDNNWSSLKTQYGIRGTGIDKGAHALLGNLGSGVGIIEWGDYDPDNEYRFYHEPTLSSLQFVIGDRWDSWYGTNWDNQAGMYDNSGELTLKLYECLPQKPQYLCDDTIYTANNQSSLTWLDSGNGSTHELTTMNFGSSASADDPFNNRTYYINRYGNNDELAYYDHDSDTHVPVGNLSVSSFFTKLAFDIYGRLYGLTDDHSFYLIKEDSSVEKKGVVSGISTGGDIIFDQNNILYLIGTNGKLYTVDLSTLGASLVKNTGLSNVTGIAYRQGVFYVSTVNSGKSNIYTMDKAGNISGPLNQEPVDPINDLSSCLPGTPPVCGDGVGNQAGEECDGVDGVATDGSNFCTSTCKLVPVYDGSHSCPPETVESFVGNYAINSRSANGIEVQVNSGNPYLFKVSGTYQYTNNSVRTADAAYATLTNWGGVPGTRNDIGIWGTNRGVTSVLADFGLGMGVVEWDNDRLFDFDHTYEKVYTPTSPQVNFLISDWWDDWYGSAYDNQSGMGDNSGELNLAVYECVPASTVNVCKYDDSESPLQGWEVALASEIVQVSTPINVSDESGTNSVDLPAGNYLIKVNGTYRFANWGAYGIADAEWSYRKAAYTPNGVAGWIKGEGYFASDCGLDARVNGECVDWGDLSSSHVYTYLLKDHSGGPINLSIYDSAYGDNQNDGLFSFEIYKVNFLGTTEGNGCTTFEGVPYGEYILDEVLQANWVNVSGKASLVAIDDSQVNFGLSNRLNLGSISGVKWEDVNGDGVRDAGENGLPGWTICLDLNESTTCDSGEPIRTTDANGEYIFENLVSGEYWVIEEQQPGWVQTSPRDVVFHRVDLEPGSNKAADFGNFELGRISGYKFKDINDNGIWEQDGDYPEPGVENWEICLKENDLETEECVPTNADGYYEFGGLVSGNYIVSEKTQSDWLQTWPTTDAGTYPITITSGANVADRNFGNAPPISLDLDKDNDKVAGVVSPGGIVTYTLTVVTGERALSEMKLIDVLPFGFIYQSGSATINGTPALSTEPALSFFNKVLIWNWGFVPAESTIIITYKVKVENSNQPASYTNFAWVTGRGSPTEVESEIVESVVRIDPTYSYSGEVGGQVLGESTGQVLGATLPAAGSETWYLLAALGLIGTGLFIRKKYLH